MKKNTTPYFRRKVEEDIYQLIEGLKRSQKELRADAPGDDFKALKILLGYSAERMERVRKLLDSGKVEPLGVYAGDVFDEVEKQLVYDPVVVTQEDILQSYRHRTKTYCPVSHAFWRETPCDHVETSGDTMWLVAGEGRRAYTMSESLRDFMARRDRGQSLPLGLVTLDKSDRKTLVFHED